MLTRVQVSFHGVTYVDTLDVKSATVASIRHIAAEGCKQQTLPEDQYAVFCCGLRVEDTDLLADLGVFDKFEVRALVPPVTGKPEALSEYIKVEQFVDSTRTAADGDENARRGVKVEQGDNSYSFGDPTKNAGDVMKNGGEEGADVKPKISGMKRGRVGDFISSSVAKAELKIDNKLWSTPWLGREDQEGEGGKVVGKAKHGSSTAGIGNHNQLGAQLIEEGLEYQRRAAELLANNSFEFNFIIGSIATQIPGKKVEGGNYNDRYYDWYVYVRDQNNRDLSKVISKVKFRLHHTFDRARQIQVFEKPPFQLREMGWGQFDVFVSIYIRGVEKPLEYAKLLCFGDPLRMAHVIPPHPPREEPLSRFPHTDDFAINEDIHQATILNPTNAALANGLKALLPLPPISTTALSDGKRAGGIQFDKYKEIYLHALKQHQKDNPYLMPSGGGGTTSSHGATNGELPDDEKEYRNLCKIRDELREINAERRRKTEYEMVANRAHFFDMTFKDEIRGNGSALTNSNNNNTATSTTAGGGVAASSSPLPQGAPTKY